MCKCYSLYINNSKPLRKGIKEMVEVSYKEYSKEKANFLLRHGEWKVETSPLQGTVYYKTYICEDGAVWYERMEKRTLYKVVEINGFDTTASVDIQETEFWHSDDSASKLMYEKW